MKLLTVEETAETLRMSPDRIRTLLRDGKALKGRKVGKAWTVTEDSIRKFEETREGQTKKGRKTGQKPQDLMGVHDLLLQLSFGTGRNEPAKGLLTALVRKLKEAPFEMVTVKHEVLLDAIEAAKKIGAARR